MSPAVSSEHYKNMRRHLRRHQCGVPTPLSVLARTGLRKNWIEYRTWLESYGAVAEITSGCSQRLSTKVRDARKHERHVCARARGSRRAE
jgi:hypothetical protein